MRDEQISVDPEETFDTYELDESWEEEDAWTESDIREDADTWDGGRAGRGGRNRNAGRNRRNSGQKENGNPFLKAIVIILAVLLTLLFAGAAVFMIGRWRGKKALSEAIVPVEVEKIVLPETVEVKEGAIVYDGETWLPDENRINILLMGLDVRTINTDDTIGAGNSGQADVLLIASLDPDGGPAKLISINRDSIVDVNIYTADRSYLYSKPMHICLAYGYGDGREFSCENTVRSVQRLMYGVQIHAYAAMDLDGLSALNDLAGGVTLTPLETLAGGITEGQEITLTGKQVETYIRSRDSENPDPEVARTGNLKRMERQKQYFVRLVQLLLEKVKNEPSYALTIYNRMKDYMITDISADRLTYLTEVMLKSGFGNSVIAAVPGEAVMGEVYAEYHVDDAALFPLILEWFYEKEES